MRALLRLFSICVVVSFIALPVSSCNRKVGCPANESAHVKPNRRGELPTKGGSSQLFPKSFNKKKKRRRN
ncbi:hypothetical protein [Phaeodactylibacter luteus]|uniref:Secreted protein n=1 Tax=Phaeodactylibacter luteus TaxID=1564516 RepID=A0A5C6RI29_9BACT|nr:hypothetical protein [Phaeodactylibacter luteus]TXB61609.1 hypothetical protein FRY97_18215 [Phaeodactylibacter luteus]